MKLGEETAALGCGSQMRFEAAQTSVGDVHLGVEGERKEDVAGG